MQSTHHPSQHNAADLLALSAKSQFAFRALADPTRREIISHLAKSDMTIAQVADQFPTSRGAIKKHLSILQEGDLISVRSRGREKVNHLEVEALKPVSDWINYFNQFWDDKLTDLQTAIQIHQDKLED